MGKLSAISAQPMVREYAQGAASDALAKLRIANFLAPRVSVASTVGRYKVYTEKNRFRIPDTLRSVGGRATELGFTASDATYALEAHALDFPVDKVQEQEEAEIIDLLNEGADMAAEVGALSHEKQVIDMAMTALGAGTGAVFDASADPVDILDGHILNIIKASKMGELMGIKMLFGATAWKIFKNHSKVTAKFTNNPRGVIPQVTQSMASELFLCNPMIETTYSAYDAAAEGLAESISFVLDSNIIVFACKESPTRRDPSFMKTFAKRDQFMVPGSYEREDGRVEVAKFDWQVLPVVTNSAAAIRLNVSTS